MVSYQLLLAASAATAAAKGPFLTQTGTQTWVFGNDLWNVTQGPNYATNLYSTLVGQDLVGTAYGHYADIDGATLLEWTSASVVAQGDHYIDIAFVADQLDFHWVVFDDLQGAYQYVVNKDTPWLTILRSLWRLNPDLFTNARTHLKDDVLPPFALYANATEVQDETFALANGTCCITKYDWANFVRHRDFYGVYGPGVVGSWWIHPSTEYFSGNQLSQTLTVHRESETGDAVQLNVFQDTSHFRVANNTLAPVGKIWGPWLWYLNNGSQEDVQQRHQQELAHFPYAWLHDPAYQARGALTGTLTLADGRPAAGAAVFLGDIDISIRPLVQGTDYYYTTTADQNGYFALPNVRAGAYGLYAWADGDPAIADVYTNVTLAPVTVTNGTTTALGDIAWPLPAGGRTTPIFQVGAFDKRADGFANSGLPYQFNIISRSPANLTFTVGESDEATDWYYAISALGTWTIAFHLSADDLAAHRAPTSNVTDNNNNNSSARALLSLSIASYSQSLALDVDVNGRVLGALDKTVLANDAALYRSGRISGEWRFVQYAVDPAVLVEGINTVGFTVTRSTTWRGLMWDSILLEWVD